MQFFSFKFNQKFSIYDFYQINEKSLYLFQLNLANHIAKFSYDKIKKNQTYDLELNIVAKKFSHKEFYDIYQACQKVNYDFKKLVILSKRKSSYQAFQIFINGKLSQLNNFKKAIFNMNFEINIRPYHKFATTTKLAVFDMDSTLIQTEIIVELARFAQVEDKVSKITEAAMQGKLNFKESFIQRVSLLNGIDEKILKQIRQTLPFTFGVKKMAKILKNQGYKLAILSGGFQYFADFIKEYLDFDYAFANHLDIKNHQITGKIKDKIIDGYKKGKILVEIAKKENIPLENVIAIGDGANDLIMMEKALIGVAFKAKPVVKKQALTNISHYGLDVLPYILGIKDE